MRRVIVALFAGLLLCAQTPMVPGFPPGVFQSRAPLDATGGAAYIAPGDINGAAYMWSGLRAYSASVAAATGNLADIVDTATGTFPCTIKAKTNGQADLTSTVCTGNTLSVTTFCTVTHAAGCSITKLYDQTGNNHDVINTTLVNMPTLNLTAVSSLPCAQFSGTQALQTSAAVSIAGPFSISTVYETAVSGTLVYDDNNGNRTGQFSGSGGLFTFASSSGFNSTSANSVFHAVQALSNGASSSTYIDGALTNGSLTTTFTANGHINVGAQTITGSTGLTGSICETGIWAADKSANNVSMNSNQHGTNGWNF